jgi:hypothetical protein
MGFRILERVNLLTTIVKVLETNMCDSCGDEISIGCICEMIYSPLYRDVTISDQGKVMIALICKDCKNEQILSKVRVLLEKYPCDGPCQARHLTDGIS